MSKVKNELMVFNNESFGVEARQVEDTIEFKIDGVAKSLGFVDSTKGDKVYVKWNRVNEHLHSFGYSTPVSKGDFLAEQYVYLLGMKANNKFAIEFQKWLAFDVLPSIRKHKAYISENADEEYVNNELRFSKCRTIKTFSNAKVSELDKLYLDFRSYVDVEYKYKTDERLARYKSVEKGLELLHDNTAKSDATKIGDCYNIRLLKERVIIDRTTLEKRISGGEKGGKTRTINNLNYQLENSTPYPKLDEFTWLDTHGISNNYLFTLRDEIPRKTDTYIKWLSKFPFRQMKSKDTINIDWNKPIKIFLKYVAISSIDHINMDKASVDTILTKFYGIDDNIVHNLQSDRVDTCDSYYDGKIGYVIKNI